ncbi:MAG: hypothetical protein KF773_00495 [Deltaproteobacteria bacterium]|nr:hypothetical protein [Deltaproteobacteria bacterium]MCW5801323.1 hypothetical protein [Deltaproteobacteria bacterium]
MRIVLAPLLLCLAASPAFADDAKKPAPAPQQPADATVMSGGECDRARKLGKTCVLSIEGIDVEGNVLGPDGIRVDIKWFGAVGSLITLRRDFIQEIVRSAEDL